MYCKTKDNKNIYFELKGNLSSTQTIIFLNGLSQTTLAWGLVTPYFEKEYKILLIDFIFQGQSDNEGEVRDFNMHSTDVLSIMENLSVDNPIIVGLSYGSLVAQHFAVLYPEKLKKMILISTFAHKTPYYEAIELSWMNALKFGGYSLMLDVMLPYVLSDVYFEKPLIPIDFFKSTKKDVVDAKSLSKLMQATAERKDFRQELSKVQCKTLVIHGRLDGLFPVYLGQEVANQIKNSKFTIIENAGHTLNIEEVDKVSNCILDFIKS
jgi:pimeloyl-ACP methyl ester carboxylesterase